MTCEEHAREKIDLLLEKAGWKVQDMKEVNLYAGPGVAIREFPLKTGHGFADYMLYIDARAAGVIEAKKVGSTLTGVEIQSDKYAKGLPDNLPAWSRPLPFCYQSTGEETRFTNNLEPDPRSRDVFSFHKPEYFDDEIKRFGIEGAEAKPFIDRTATLRGRLQNLPPLIEDGLWSAQVRAINNLDKSMIANRPRSLIQMATGSGKTFTAINFIYRYIKFSDARRVLFLVDRGNLGKQTLKEFQQYVSPYNNFKFSEEFIVRRLTSNTLDTTARVCISTIQRMYSMLKGRELAEEDEERSVAGLEHVFKEPEPIEYNPAIPIGTFDIIVTDECHRSIYNLWRQVLDYFDAFIIGLTATPNKQTYGFFNQNLVMEYPHEQAVADGVNVNYDVYRIRTRITTEGSTVDAGFYIDKRDRETRSVRWEQLDDDLEYEAGQLDRDVVSIDQIRTVIQTYRDKVLTEIFPGREWVPKTLIFAKDDSHAEDIVKIVREEFGKGNDFAQKITYKTTGKKPEDLIAEFRTSPMPRIAVTVDMIATGTDIKPLEVALFMRTVKSRTYFEQMKGRGVRVINDDDLKAVTPDAGSKDIYVIVDAAGVCEGDKTDSRPLDRKKSVPLDKLLQAVALGNTEPEVISTIAARLARLDRHLSDQDRDAIKEMAKGKGIKELTSDLIKSLDPDLHIERVYLRRAEQGRQGDTSEPTGEEIKQAVVKTIQEAVIPLHDPGLRNLLIELHKKSEQVIDHISQDQVIEAGYSKEALERAKGVVESFEQFIQKNKDEITALQVIFSKPYKQRLKYEDVKDLAEKIHAPPMLWSESQLWQAYAALDKTRVKGADTRRIMTDLVSLVRFAMHQENELVPFPEKVEVNFNAWLAQQESADKKFSEEQRQWLTMIRDHIAANLGIDTDDFDYAPFAQQGGLGKVHQLFGGELNTIIEELNVYLCGAA